MAAGDRLLLFGGCSPKSHDSCKPTRHGFAFDPAERTWKEIPPAPFAVTGAGAWTGDEAVLLDTAGEGALRGLAYEPDTKRWRSLPEAPIRAKGSDAIWTGSELVVWGGGGHAGPAAEAGAAYDPATDSWRRIADAPLSLNAVDLVWTGSEVVAFGSRLDRRNWSQSRVAIGAAYDPATDIWRPIADSRLSPQAHSAEWIDGRVVAYDYGLRYQRYEPDRDRWSAKRRIPLEPGECYPDSAEVAGLMLAFYCGQVALFDPAMDAWSVVGGGLTERVSRSNAYGRPIPIWRFAELAVLDEAVYFLAEGITFSRRRVAQYGFPDSPASFWSYRPLPLPMLRGEENE